MDSTQINNRFHTPVLLNVFNRPEETSRVLAALVVQQVPVLYVHCDGAREGREDDVRNVKQVQQLIKESVTWPCELHTMYEEQNYGCGVGPYRAITWFFENVEDGIILEDDCVPHPDFFMYCQELLERYRDNERIAVIGGTNRHPGKSNNKYSYFFSAYSETWGWATWRRVWKNYDYDFMVTDKEFYRSMIPHVLSYWTTKWWVNLLRTMREDNKAGTKTYWDYQLDLKCMYEHKIHIIPSVNLISNIGFNERATHTFASSHAQTQVDAILPLRHPKCIVIRYSDNIEYNVFLKGIKSFIKKLIKHK